MTSYITLHVTACTCCIFVQLYGRSRDTRLASAVHEHLNPYTPSTSGVTSIVVDEHGVREGEG